MNTTPRLKLRLKFQNHEHVISVYKQFLKAKNSAAIQFLTYAFKPTETFQYTHFSLCHPPGVKKDFIKGVALRLLRRNSSKNVFERKLKTLNHAYVKRALSEVQFENAKLVLLQKPNENK